MNHYAQGNYKEQCEMDTVDRIGTPSVCVNNVNTQRTL